MPLSSGARLGPYQVVSHIGAGGMGEVYRATDTRLDRIVAIKVLPPDITDNPMRRQRFEREARAASRLSHPHICALYDVGEQDGRPFLVMEYLEGETLASRLARGALPIHELLQIGLDVAGALEHAHRAGLIHRDLKPANIMLTRVGAKLLDFGLARFDSAPPHGVSMATMTAADTLTEEGTILGTVPYMAPEQLEERAADARTDIFALGTVIYEMATGRRPFEGSSRASVIAGVLERNPTSITAARPAGAGDSGAIGMLDQIISRSHAKDPDDRWQTAADMRHALELVAASGSTAGALAPPRARTFTERLGWPTAIAAIVVAALGVLIVNITRQRGAPNRGTSLRYTVPPPENSTFNPAAAFMALSPDGKKLVFVAAPKQGGMALWIRTEDAVTPRQLPGTEGASQPFWSADSRFVAFGTDQGQLKNIDVVTGLTEVIAEGRFTVGAWNRSGDIVFRRSTDPHLLRISSVGGAVSAATAVDASRGETVHNSPAFLPDDRHFLYQARSSQPAFDGFVYIGSLDSRDRVQVCQCRSNAVYANGHLLYVRDYNLVAQPFDVDHFRLTGEPTVLAGQIEYSPATGARGAFSVSQTGALAYRTLGESRLTWFDRRGGPLGSLGEPGSLANPALSPDEQYVAVDRRDRTGASDVWVIEIKSGTQSKLTSGGGADKPLWMSNGTIVYRVKSGFSMKSSNGTGAEEPLLDGVGTMSGPSSWAPNQRVLVFDRFDTDTGGDVARLSLDDRTPVPVVQTKHFELQGRVSPDGRWLAFVSNESGKYDVYVRPFPEGGGKWVVSPDGGSEPAWSHDGRELFYLAPDRWLMSVAVKIGGPVLERAAPARLFETRMSTLANPAFTKNQYVVTTDGRFLINQPTGQPAPITMIVNWPAELRKPR